MHQKFHHEYYTPERMSLWVRSPLNINEVANLVRSSFTKIKEHNKGVKYKTPKFLTSLKDNQIKVAKLKSNQSKNDSSAYTLRI